MDTKKVSEVIAIYRKHFLEKEIPAMEFLYKSKPGSKKEILAHCHAMLDKMEIFLKEGRIEKTFRWLGFMQGCLWSTGEHTLEDLMNHNRPDVKKPESSPHYFGRQHYAARSFELCYCVLNVLKKRQGKPVLLDELLEDDSVLKCYTPRHFMRFCNPPNIRRARQAVRGAVSYLRSKGHVIESTKEYGQVAYSWLGK